MHKPQTYGGHACSYEGPFTLVLVVGTQLKEVDI